MRAAYEARLQALERRLKGAEAAVAAASAASGPDGCDRHQRSPRHG